MEKLNHAIDALDHDIYVWLVGIVGFFYKTIYYRITSWQRIAKEAVLCVFVCAVLMPYLKETFGMSDTITYLLVWGACTNTDSNKD